MKDDLVEEVLTIQTSMVESAGPGFLDSELDDLRCLIRLTVEFYHFLRNPNRRSLDSHQLRYTCESIFSGVDSFCNVSAAYRMTGGSVHGTIAWGVTSDQSLEENFTFKYREFSLEREFSKQCRHLLDLFRLQIVFAAMSYQ